MNLINVNSCIKLDFPQILKSNNTGHLSLKKLLKVFLSIEFSLSLSLNRYNEFFLATFLIFIFRIDLCWLDGFELEFKYFNVHGLYSHLKQ